MLSLTLGAQSGADAQGVITSIPPLGVRTAAWQAVLPFVRTFDDPITGKTSTRLLTLGEVVSSPSFTKQLLGQYIQAAKVYNEEISPDMAFMMTIDNLPSVATLPERVTTNDIQRFLQASRQAVSNNTAAQNVAAGNRVDMLKSQIRQRVAQGVRPSLPPAPSPQGMQQIGTVLGIPQGSPATQAGAAASSSTQNSAINATGAVPRGPEVAIFNGQGTATAPSGSAPSGSAPRSGGELVSAPMNFPSQAAALPISAPETTPAGSQPSTSSSMEPMPDQAAQAAADARLDPSLQPRTIEIAPLVRGGMVFLRWAEEDGRRKALLTLTPGVAAAVMRETGKLREVKLTPGTVGVKYRTLPTGSWTPTMVQAGSPSPAKTRLEDGVLSVPDEALESLGCEIVMAGEAVNVRCGDMTVTSRRSVKAPMSVEQSDQSRSSGK